MNIKACKARKVLILLMTMLFVMLSANVYANTEATGQTPSGIPFSELDSTIDAFVTEHIGISTPGVAIVIVHEGEIIFSRGWGYADIENNTPFDPSITVSRHGSINKTFVWVAAMQLAERGLLDLDADIANYLSPEDIALFDFEMPFTMRDLMNHGAGFAETFHYLESASVFDWQNFSVRDGLLASQPSQIFTPGTASSYSNWGSAFAGYIVSQISGLGFADFNMQNILLPAGMENTLDEPLWTSNQAFMQNMAVGYSAINSGFRERSISHLGGHYPAGSSMGTAEDLARFIIALTPEQGNSGSLFENRATLDLLFTQSSPDPENRPSFYHGFMPHGIFDAIGHSGGIAGFTANFGIVPEERFGWVVLSNTEGEFDITLGLTHILAENTIGQIVPTLGDLPHASVVEGQFMPLRRTQGSFMDFLTNTAIANVTALDENTIRLAMGAFDLDFVQIEPYVFRLVSASEPFAYASFSELRFRMENGEPMHIYAPGSDFSLPPQWRVPFTMFSVGVVTTSVLFFLVMPIVLLIAFVVKKMRNKPIDKTKFRLLNVGMMLCGLFLLVNNVLNVVLRFFVSDAIAITASNVNPHIWTNYLLAGLSALMAIGSILFLVKEKGAISIKSKVIYGTTIVLLALLIFILRNWNFFVLL